MLAFFISYIFFLVNIADFNFVFPQNSPKINWRNLTDNELAEITMLRNVLNNKIRQMDLIQLRWLDDMIEEMKKSGAFN